MIKERIPISGDLKSKVRQLMEYAGWQEGRKVDISIAEKYYADHGVPMMKTTQRFYRKYFGLCCEWYLEQKKLNWAADFQFALFPYLVNGIKNHLEDAYFRDMSGCELAEIEQAAGQKCQPIGHVGYYYPAEVWISEYGKWFYPADLPLEAVRQLADGVPVTKELVTALNPKRNEWEEIKAGLGKIGYPNEL